VITEDRTLVAQPTKLIKGVESVVKWVAPDQEFSLFVRVRVFGTTGNAYRHCDADGGERRQVLLGIAALCGWMQAFLGVPALDALSGEMNAHVAQALDEARALPVAVLEP